MKKYLTIFCLFCSSFSFSQDSLVKDSALYYKVEQIKIATEYMRYNFEIGHQEFVVGNVLIGTGFLSTIIGIVIPEMSRSTEIRNNDLRSGLMTTGYIVGIIGFILHTDAHKHIGRASRWDFEGNSLTFRIISE